MKETKKKAICFILHFYSNHQISNSFPLKYKNENKLHSNTQWKIRRMWFVLVVISLWYKYVCGFIFSKWQVLLVEDAVCLCLQGGGGLGNQQVAVLHSEDKMRSGRTRGLSAFLYRPWRGWNTQADWEGALHCHSLHGDVTCHPLGLSLKQPPGCAQFYSIFTIF